MFRPALLFALLAFPCLVVAAPPSGAGWHLVFDDEFSGEALDTDKWRHNPGARRDAVNSPAAVSVSGGNLAITTFTSGGTHYTDYITTQNALQYAYGYVEARIDFDTTSGMWSAFWMQSPTMGNPIGSPQIAGTEIDICEHRTVDGGGANIDGKIVGNIHWDGYGADHKSTGYTSADLGLGTGFHIYGMEWTPTQQKFYIDGVLRWTVNSAANSPVSQRSEYILLSSEVDVTSTTWAGPIPAAGYGTVADSTTKMTVDYVRVYTRAETAVNGNFGGHLAPFTATNEAGWSATGGRSTGAAAGSIAPLSAAGASLQQTVRGLMPATDYVLTGWGNPGATSPRLDLGVSGHGGATVSQSLTANGYAQATVPFTTGATNRTASVFASGPNTGSTGYVDDFLLRRSAAVNNGGVEEGAAGAWNSIYGGTGIVADGNEYGGSYAFLIPASGSSAGAEQDVAGLTPGTAYRLTGWTTNGNAGLTFGVKNHGGTQVASTVAASAWTRATVNFTTGAAATGARVFAFRGSSAADAYADAFFLSEPLTAPWTGADIAASGLAGTSGRRGAKFVVQAGGNNIAGTADAFHFVQQPVTGDATITARVLGLDGISVNAKAAVMIRESTATGARSAALSWGPLNQLVQFSRRTSTGGTTANNSVASIESPWLRLTRSGNLFSAYTSPDGLAWTFVGSQSISMSTSALIGLAACAGDSAQLAEVAFGDVSVTGAVPAVQVTAPVEGATVTANGQSVRVTASVTGSGSPVVAWSQVSGPGVVTFANAALADTTAVFSAPGAYVLRCSATNATGSGGDDIFLNIAAAAAADPTLVLRLRLDESAGTTAADSSAGGHLATATGSVAWLPGGGIVEGAAVFDGAASYLTVPDSALLDGTAAFTLAYWFRANVLDGSGLVSKRNGDTDNNAFTTYVNNLGNLRVDIATNNNRFSSVAFIDRGRWYHVALVFDGTQATASRARLYVDGVLDKTASETSSSIGNLASPLSIGILQPGAATSFDGLIDDVRFYRRALSAAEVAAVQSETGLKAPLVAPGAAPSTITRVAATLGGSVTAETGAAPVIAWSKVSGPGTVTFGNAAQAATSVTFSQAGSYVLQLAGTNANAQTQAMLAVEVGLNPALFNDWLALQWPGETNPAINGPTADPNGDGEANLYEYATAQNPNVATRVLPGVVKIGANLEFTYTRGNAAVADGTTFVVEWSDTLAAGSWSTAGVSEQLLTDNGTVQTRKAALAAGSGPRFVRLTVTK